MGAFLDTADLAITISDDNTLRVWDARLGDAEIEHSDHGLPTKNERQGIREPFALQEGQAALRDRRLPETVETLPDKMDLIARVRSSVPRCLTATEREQYYIPGPSPSWCREHRLWPDQAILRLRKAEEELRRSEPKETEVRSLFQEAVGLSPRLTEEVKGSWVAYWIEKGRIHAFRRQHDLAEAAFQAVLALDPALGDAIPAIKARALWDSSADVINARNPADYPKAIEGLREALKLRPAWGSELARELAVAHNNRAWDFYTKNQSADGLLDTEQAYLHDPRSIYVLSTRATILHSLDRTEEALEMYNEAIARGANWPTVYFGRGEIKEKRGSVAEAVEDYKRSAAASAQSDIQKAARSRAEARLKVLGDAEAAPRQPR